MGFFWTTDEKDVQIGGKFENYIALLDSSEIIRELIKSAVTDSENEIKIRCANKPAVSNLLTIYGLFSGKSSRGSRTTHKKSTIPFSKMI